MPMVVVLGRVDCRQERCSDRLTCSSPPSYAQILTELQWNTRLSTQDVLLQDPGAVGSVPVPLDPAGKVFSYLFYPQYMYN